MTASVSSLRSTSFVSIPSILLGVCAALAGCGSPSQQPGAKDAGSDVGVQEVDTGGGGPDTGSDTDVASTSGMIGPAGGVVTSPSGAAVSVPAGALTAPAAIAVAVVPLGTATAPAGLPALQAAVSPASDVVALTPHGQTFSTPVTVRIPFQQALAAGAGSQPLHLYTAAPGGSWSEVTGARVVGAAVEADVAHFSFFIVGFEAPGQMLPESQGRKLDLLFMVDNSQSMTPLQQKLLQNFPVLMQVLKSLPGGLPDIHIGVVSSDMGAGQVTAIAQCTPGGNMGILQHTPRITGCTPPQDAYIAATQGEATKNYDGTIEDAFSCIAALGQGGCGYEHQLESVAVALGARGTAPAENAGFLRPDAALAIVLITNEDDCSAPPDTLLFDTTSMLVSDPLGPNQSYRCNEFGHLCGGVRPPRVGNLGDMVTLADCHSAEDGTLNRISDYVALFKGLKPDPSMVSVAAITGPVTPYTVTWIMPLVTTDPSPWPNVEHSCMQNSGEYADPAVRIGDLVTAFGGNGSLYSICGDSFGPALTQIGSTVAGQVSRCLVTEVVDATGAAPALRPGCAIYESVPAGAGMRTETAIPACGGATPADPCFGVNANAGCGAGAELAITRTGAVPAGGVLVVRCQ
jgi:hypothetical protein